MDTRRWPRASGDGAIDPVWFDLCRISVYSRGMNKFPVPIEAHTPDGDGYVNIAPFSTSDGVPKVVLIIRTDTPVVYEAMLDGHPAIAVFLGEDKDGTGNTPWELGHLLCQQWDEAKKLAGK